MRVTLAVPTYRREEVLCHTIAAFLALEDPPDEMVVVDQTEEHEPATARALGAWADSGAIRWIRHSPPSASGARNRALAEATGDFVLFVDDDIVPADDLVAVLRSRMRGDDQPHVVSGQIVNTGQSPTDALPPPVPGDRRFGWLEFPANYARPFRGPVGVSANLCIRRSMALAVGGFDERFYGSGYREESDFLLRIHRAGGRIVFEPSASVVHLGAVAGGTRGRDTIEKPVRESVVACELYFLLKNYGPVVGLFPFVRHAADFVRRRLGRREALVPEGASRNEAVRRYPHVGLRSMPGIAWRVLKGVILGVVMHLKGAIYLKCPRRPQ